MIMLDMEEYLHIKYVKEKLEEAELEAKKPGASWTPVKNTLKKLRAKYGGLHGKRSVGTIRKELEAKS